MTYAQVNRAAAGFAGGLQRVGLGQGDRVAVQMPNRWEFVPVLLGCLWAGVVPTQVPPAYRDHEMMWISEHIGARAFIVGQDASGFDHARLAHQVRRRVGTVQHVCVAGEYTTDACDVASLFAGSALDRPLPSDPGQAAFFLLSGGTTDRPKVVPRTHGDYLYDVRHSVRLADFHAERVYLAALPLVNTFPLSWPGMLGALLVGGRTVLVTSPRPQSVIDAMSREGVVVTAAVPTVVGQRLSKYDPHRWDLASLSLLQVDGVRMTAAQAALAREVFGCTVQQGYGISEGMLNLTRPDDEQSIIQETQGHPYSAQDQKRVVAPDDTDVPEGRLGELLVRSPAIFSGYFGVPEHNEQAFTEGWFCTGDLVRLPSSGNLVGEGPKRFCLVDEIPLTAVGKVDKPALKQLAIASPELPRALVPAACGER